MYRFLYDKGIKSKSMATKLASAQKNCDVWALGIDLGKVWSPLTALPLVTYLSTDGLDKG